MGLGLFQYLLFIEKRIDSEEAGFGQTKTLGRTRLVNEDSSALEPPGVVQLPPYMASEYLASSLLQE